MIRYQRKRIKNEQYEESIDGIGLPDHRMRGLES